MENASPAPPKSLWELYWGFLSIGARSFGGVLPWAHRVMVEEKRWLAPADFAEVLALCQFLPGPNVGNVSVVLGRRWFGPLGSVVGFRRPHGVAAGLGFLPGPALRRLFRQPGGESGCYRHRHRGRRPVHRHRVQARQASRAQALGLALAAGCFGVIALGRVSLFAVLPVAILLGWLAARRGLI